VKSAGAPARVVVEAPARLHLGFIDLHGGCGRTFGSIGVAIERPRYVVELCRGAHNAEPGGRGAPRDDEDGAALSRIRSALAESAPVTGPIGIRVIERIPRHQGLGSGTQRDLALASGLGRLAGRTVVASDVAGRLGRGRRSGVGVAAFEGGGLIVDAGVGTQASPPRAAGDAPPVIFQRPLPPDWRFVLASPEGEEGLHGPREDAVFRSLPPMSDAVAGRISRLVLMKALPAALGDDIEGFGAAISEIQLMMGEVFAPHQGGAYASARGAAIADLARRHGAAGVGQSSWGPTVFAIVRGDEAARELIERIRAFAGDRPLALWHTAASPRGAAVRAEA